ncbi:transcobalamin-2 [Pangasianodon hypophthalmus]|uniref:transcobalamin-2 n=1 Tax=Pangasianodon hypophthalmus TaxID=310915 RepID=UPI0023075FEF|nr:transcobalamin-2 [Pangasianodon hypophthalmus]
MNRWCRGASSIQSTLSLEGRSAVMKMIICILAALFALTAADTCGSDTKDLLLKLNKDLLRATESQESLPNPSIHIALRLSPQHNLVKEGQYLDQLKTKFHEDIQSTLNKGQPVVGRLALYVMALKASCQELRNVSLSTGEKSEPLLTHMKKQMELEKDHIASSHRPLTNYYQYSLGILALCVSGVRVSSHVSHKLTHAALHTQFEHGDSVCVDTLAMAGMALQCLKDAETPVKNKEELEKALTTIKKKLLASQRPDGHLGNEFSTGLAVQALLAMGNKVDECSAPMMALWSDVKKGTYHNPMAISQTLPALQQRTYLHLKNKECIDEDDSLDVDPVPVVPTPMHVHVQVEVEVVKADGSSFTYQINVTSGVSLLDSLTLLQQQTDFKFETEDSLWGPFLSVVNGEQARQTDRRYWHLASDGKGLSQGIKDYKIEAAQKITIKNTSY